MNIEAIGKHLYIDRKGDLDQQTLNKLTGMFYALAREFGICQGTIGEDGFGVDMCNPEWTTLKSIFFYHLHHQLECELMFASTPADIYAKPRTV